MSKKLVLLAAAMTALCLLPQSLPAQEKKDNVTMAMALEPPGLDPTNAAAAAIAEVTLYNVYETLTKVQEDGTAVPLLAESFEAAFGGVFRAFVNLYPSAVLCDRAAQVPTFPFPSVPKGGRRHAFWGAVPRSVIPQPTIM